MRKVTNVGQSRLAVSSCLLLRDAVANSGGHERLHHDVLFSAVAYHGQAKSSICLGAGDQYPKNGHLACNNWDRATVLDPFSLLIDSPD